MSTNGENVYCEKMVTVNAQAPPAQSTVINSENFNGSSGGGGGGGGRHDDDDDGDDVESEIIAAAATTEAEDSVLDPKNGNKFPENPLKILNLVERISSTTNSLEMQIIINKYLQDLTNAEYVFVVPLLPASEEGLIQVIGDKLLEKEIRFSVTSEDIDNISEEGFNGLMKDVNKEYNEMIEMVVGNGQNTLIFDITNTKMTSPPSSSPSSTLNNVPFHRTSLFVCIAGENSLRDNYGYYIKNTFKYILGHLLTAFDLFEEKRVRNQCQNLLKVARRLLSKIGDLGQLLQGVMAEAKDMTGAERCSLFLIDEYTGELVSKVFDSDEAAHEIRIEQGKGIAGHVAKTGKLLNIRNAYQHPLFYKGVDEQTGFKTRNILCFPICDEEKVVGVAQLCNKLDGCHFDKCDEEIATAFSIYCGISIMHALVHKQVQKAEARHKLSQELLIYHMKVPEDDVKTLLNKMSQTKPNIENFSSFLYMPRDTNYTLTVRLSMEMFYDLNFVKHFKIRNDKLARFLLIVQKGYRDTIPYHNWIHAFSVAHFAYCLLTNLKLIERGYLTELQGLSLLIACFCHDLDHRGTNNSYQMESKSPLAKLYSSEGSVNERHHLSQAMCILNEENSKILDSLSTEQFKECIDNLKYLILATDLAHHFGILKELKQLNGDNLRDRSKYLMSLIITCCDLSDQIKPWPTTLNVADLVYAEFFAQGDLEKQLGLAPNQMMDRQKACIPELQIEFISTVIKPTYEILCNLFPETEYFLTIIDKNQSEWNRLKCTNKMECLK